MKYPGMIEGGKREVRIEKREEAIEKIVEKRSGKREARSEKQEARREKRRRGPSVRVSRAETRLTVYRSAYILVERLSVYLDKKINAVESFYT